MTHGITNWEQARDFFDRRRDKESSYRNVPGLSNTKITQWGAAFAVRYFRTDVVTYFPDGKVIIDTDGYTTPTTRSRISEFCPGFFYWRDRDRRVFVTTIANPEPRPEQAYLPRIRWVQALRPGGAERRAHLAVCEGTMVECSEVDSLPATAELDAEWDWDAERHMGMDFETYHGAIEAWQEHDWHEEKVTYTKEERDEAKRKRAALVEWRDRNEIPFRESITIERDGTLVSDIPEAEQLTLRQRARAVDRFFARFQ